MKYPQILLLGGNGQIGWELQMALKPLGSIWAPSRKEIDLAFSSTIVDAIRRYQPDLIVNAAAYTDVDQAESESAMAFRINATVPRIIAEEANQLQIPVLHYSTDYVFDGSASAPYEEDDPPNPLNCYGQSKLAGENGIRDVHDQFLILRTSWVYSPMRGKNFYRTMLRLLEEDAPIRVVDDQFGSPSLAHYIATRTAHILDQLSKTKTESRWGIYHVTGTQVMSWYEFALKIATENEHGGDRIIPIPARKYPTIARRPTRSILNNAKCNSAFL